MPPINSFDCPVSAVEKGADMKSRQPHSFVVAPVPTPVARHYIKSTLLGNQIGQEQEALDNEKRPIMPKGDR